MPVRNDDDRWVLLADAASTYRVAASGREMAAGSLFALPTLIGPGETAYLVDTVTIPAIETIKDLVAESDVVALPTDPPDSSMTVTDLRLAEGIGGALLASGTVHNDSRSTTRRVVVGVIALGRNGTPMAVFHDSFDIGRLDPTESKSFETDYEPGGPPVVDATVRKLIGVAFEVGP